MGRVNIHTAMTLRRVCGDGPSIGCQQFNAAQIALHSATYPLFVLWSFVANSDALSLHSQPALAVGLRTHL